MRYGVYQKVAFIWTLPAITGWCVFLLIFLSGFLKIFYKIWFFVHDDSEIHSSQNHIFLFKETTYPFNNQCFHHIETSQLICSSKYDETLVVKGLNITLRMLRSSRPGVFCENGVVKNFAKFSGKHLSYFKKHIRTTASGNSELILIIRMLLFTFFFTNSDV